MSKNTMHDSTATASRPGTGNTPAPAALRKSLKNRHVQLIALGKSPWGRQQGIKAPAVMQVPFSLWALAC